MVMEGRETAKSEAEEDMLQQTEEMVRSLERAADKNGNDEASHGAGNAALVTAVGKLAEETTKIGAFVQQTNALVQANLNEFSKQLANTDISAQRAAQAAEATVEAITPQEEQAPDTGEQPSQVEELPAADLEANKSKAWWFGKAAYRHGKARS